MALCFDSGTYFSGKIKKEIVRHTESKQKHKLKEKNIKNQNFWLSASFRKTEFFLQHHAPLWWVFSAVQTIKIKELKTWMKNL